MGPRHAETLTKLGMNTLGDMLYYFPRRYEDYSQLKPIKALLYGEQVTVIGTIQSVHTRPIRGGKSSIIEVVISDGTGGLRLSFFNQPWLANRFKQGDAISVSGKVDQYLGRLVMNSPDWEPVEVENLHTNRIVPIYPLTERITQKWLRELMNQVVTYWAPAWWMPCPKASVRRRRLMPLGEALCRFISPIRRINSKPRVNASPSTKSSTCKWECCARRRDWKSVEARRFPVSDEWLDARIASLPFTLTSAQQNALERHSRRPRLWQAHEPTPARRCRFGQDRRGGFGRCHG